MTNIGNVALISGLGIGAATAIGSFVAHEALENDGEWSSGNSKLSTFTQIGVLGGSMAAMGTHMVTKNKVALGVGGGLLFGGLAGNVAGMMAAMAID